MYRLMYRMIFLSLFVIFTTSCVRAIPEIYLKKSGNVSMELSKEAHGIAAIDISHDGKYLLAGDTSFEEFLKGSIRVWDMTEGRQLFIKKSLIQMTRAVAISPDGRYAIEGGFGMVEPIPIFKHPALVAWDLTTGNILKKAFPGSVGRWSIDTLNYSPDGRHFLAAEQSCIHLYNAKTLSVVRTFPHGCKPGIEIIKFAYPITVAIFSRDGKRIISGGTDAALHLWDVETGKEIKRFHGHKSGFAGGINSIALTPDDRYALTSSQHDDHVKLWDIETGAEVRRFSGFESHMGMHVLGVGISPDGRYAFILGDPIRIWDIKTGEGLTELKYIWKGLQTIGGFHTMRYHPNGRYILMSLFESAIRIYDVKTGEEIAVLIGFEDGEWLAITTEGYYNASENGAQYLSVKVGEARYGVDKFYDVFYRPDIVAAKLRGEDMRHLTTITMEDAIKSPPPDVEFTATPSPDSLRAKICYRVKNAGGGIGEIRLFHNGKLIESDGYYREVARATSDTVHIASLSSQSIYSDMRSVAIKGVTESTPITSRRKGDILEECKEVDVVNGENEMSVTAFNGTNTIQGALKTMKFIANVPAVEPHLYIFAVGVDEYKDKSISLKYAMKDAADMLEKIAAQSATVYRPGNIHCTLLKNDQATKSNILNAIADLSKKAKPQDSFIFFVAGHGILLQNQYYMLTHDYNGTLKPEGMLSSNEIIEMSKRIKPLSQLFIFDTCHAGGVDYLISGLYDARMSVLAKKMGLHIYASASDRQTAMDGYKGNGLFTHALLRGLNNNREADKNNDSKVSFVELGGYSKQTTATISKEIGHTQTPLIINFGRDNPLYRLH